MPQTTKANLINTEVFAESVSSKLGDALRLNPFLFTQSFTNDTAGQITVPKYAYIGDADLIPEGQPIPTDLLSSVSDTLDIVKAGKAVELTDEAIKSGFGNPIQEAENQLTRSIANGIENQLFEALTGATLTYTHTTGVLDGDAVLNGIALFGEDVDENVEKALVINPANIGDIRRDGNYDFESNQFFDLQVVISNRTPINTAYIVKNGALGLYQAKEISLEQDRDILAKSTVISGSALFATHLRDDSRAVAITFPAGV